MSLTDEEREIEEINLLGILLMTIFLILGEWSLFISVLGL